MVPPDIQMLDVLHGDRFRRLSANRWSSEGYGRRTGTKRLPRATQQQGR